MNPLIRNLFFILLIALSVLFLPAALGGVIVDDLLEEDDLENDDGVMLINRGATPWHRLSLDQVSVCLRVGISIFALFVVYLGGRSKHRRFNDRTIDPADSLFIRVLKTALFRAVFNFVLFVSPQNVLHPILIPNRRSKRL